MPCTDVRGTQHADVHPEQLTGHEQHPHSVGDGERCHMLDHWRGPSLYSFVPIASIVLVNFLGIALTVGASAIAAVPDKPIEIPFPRELALALSTVTLVFGIACFVLGAQCFYQRQVSRPAFVFGLIGCAMLIILHVANSLNFGVLVYSLVGLWFGLTVLLDWAFNRAVANGLAK